ncbi:MAG: hypothetical protein LBN29_01240 [Mediterranea sp.]|jgi:hypothetical protein|nr:hypothetical protein [Mediterranea sp.]
MPPKFNIYGNRPSLEAQYGASKKRLEELTDTLLKMSYTDPRWDGVSADRRVEEIRLNRLEERLKEFRQ